VIGSLADNWYLLFCQLIGFINQLFLAKLKQVNLYQQTHEMDLMYWNGLRKYFLSLAAVTANLF
jgi:hypothetical protein